ncbi:MAG TPA: ATP-binding protein [Candidatus Marinimicrobia bacterium]|nr:ATP-binding protein [Candidatus Neomarinimicrobiota bacterium]
MLLSNEPENLKPNLEKHSSRDILKEVKELYMNHFLVEDYYLRVDLPDEDIFVLTDSSIMIRILSNMISNGLEASQPGDELKLWCQKDSKGVTFSVWNSQFIPEDISRRIFQRNFSTKSGPGRGLGTYSMKLLSEKFLNAKVYFTTDIKNGTTFNVFLPESIELTNYYKNQAVSSTAVSSSACL